jgi:dienelactone hydrolase
MIFAGPVYGQQNDLVEDSTFLSVTTNGKPGTLEGVVIKRAGAEGRLPIALITFGIPGVEQRIKEAANDLLAGHARDMARRGWLGVVVRRRNLGASDNLSRSPSSCTSASVHDRISVDADDLNDAMYLIGQHPNADGSRILAIGASAGGAAVTAWSARNPEGLVGFINVAGGYGINCTGDVLVSVFKDYGVKSRAPSLWVYSKPLSSEIKNLTVEKMHTAFRSGGGMANLTQVGPIPQGAGIFTSVGRNMWVGELDGFLRQNNLPTWSHEDVAALMESLGVKSASARETLEKYIAAPGERAFAKQKDGAHVSWWFGAITIQAARLTALEICEREKKSCEIIMENDRVVRPTP